MANNFGGAKARGGEDNFGGEDNLGGAAITGFDGVGADNLAGDTKVRGGEV